jgi:hypothetical protein
MEPGTASLFESVLAIALLRQGNWKWSARRGPLAILPPAGGPNLGNLEGKTDCERSWIEARQEPVLRRPKADVDAWVTPRRCRGG